MPTDRIRYVNAASAGGDGTTNALSGANAAYASLSAAVAAEATDLVTADIVLRLRCGGSTADTTPIGSASWASLICDATRYLLIEPDTGFYNLGYWSTSTYRLVSTDASAVNLPIVSGVMLHVKIRGIQIGANATTGSTTRRCINGALGPTVNSIFDIQNCILWLNKTGGTNTSHTAIQLADSQWFTVYVGNNVVIHTGTDNGSGIERGNSGNWYIHNNIVVGATQAFNNTGGATNTFQLKNNAVYNCGAFGGSNFDNSDYNSTDLATATGGANDRVNQTFSFVDAGNGNYRPTAADTAIKGRGVDLSGDANLPITADMLGVAVNSPPDIGPLNYEIAAASPDGKIRIIRAP